LLHGITDNIHNWTCVSPIREIRIQIKIKVSSQKPTKEKLLKDFDGIFKKSKPFLASRFGESTPRFVEETRREYENIIPFIPYLGGMETFTRYVISAAQYTAIYRVLQKHGKTLEETGQFIYDFTEAFLNSYPKVFLRFLTGDIFSKKMMKKAKEGAEVTQRRVYPENYVASYVEGDGVEFDFGIEYTECAVCKFMKAVGAPELTPYICNVDIISSDLFGWGLRRTMSIAEGYPTCDFRFKKGGKTSITSRVLQITQSNLHPHT
jgi:hypothetical protein